MADKKISELPKINAISGSEVILPIVHDGTTQKMDVSTFGVYTSQWSATTGSNTFFGNQIISGNLSLSGNSVIAGNSTIAGNVEVGGMITAQQYNVTYVSSSVQFKSGSTEFGDSADDTHTITGTLILNGLAIGTAELMAQTASQDGVNLRISSTTGSINTTTSSFDSVFLGISSVTGAINTTTSSFDSVFLGISSFTGSLNSLTGSYATTGSNTFYGNQSITGSLSISAGEFNVTTGSGNMTSSLIFDHTQNDGVTLQLRHNDRLSFADHTFNVNVWAAGVYTTFVRNGTPYSILNVEAFDDNKIYLYRDTRLFNKSLVIDNNLTVQKGVIIGTGSLNINNGEFSITSGSGELTSSLSFTHTTVDPITGDATLALRYRNNDVGPENNAWRFVATDNGVQLRYDQYTTSNKMLFSVSSFGSNFDKLLIWRDARLFGTGLTVDDSLLVKGVITGSLLSTNGVVSSSNQLFELNQQTGSQDLVNLGISSVTGSLIGITNTLMAFTAALDNTYATDAQLYQLYQATSSIHSTTGSLNIQTGSQDLVNLGISSVTGSLIGITNGLMAFTAALDNTYATDAQLYQLYQATSSIQAFTSSQDSRNFTISQITSSIDAHILKQATQTGSQDLVNLSISTYTGSQNVINSSVDAHILKQATQTGSQDLVNLGISSVTGSLIGITNGLMAFTAALDNTYATDAQLYQLYQSTASLNTQTGSQDIVNFNISVVTSSIDSHILKQSTQTGSQDLVNLGISTFTGSLRSEVNLIEAYTASLKGAAIVSSSQQITNYYKFAETASANTFYGNQTITGSLNVGAGNITVLRSVGGAAVIVESTATNGEATLTLTGKNSSGTVRSSILKYDNADVLRLGSASPIPIQFETNDVARISIASGISSGDGSVTISTGNLIMGTSGKGIDFSANSNVAGMTSELLNDYEEGTFTPTMEGSTTAGTGTYTRQTGVYTKIGNLVTCNVWLQWSAHTGTGDILLAGFPFTSIGTTNYRASGTFGWVENLTLSANCIATMAMSPSSTVASVTQYPAGGGAATSVAMDTAANLHYSITYQTT
jgi:hypothetical protein